MTARAGGPVRGGSAALVRTAAVLALSGLVVGCAPVVEPGWTPPSWPEVPVSIVDAPPPPPTAESGLVAQRLRNDAIGVQARFGYLPGRGPLVDPFNDAVEAFVRAAIDGRVAASGRPYAPQVFPAGAGLGDRGCVPGASFRPAAELLADPAVGPAVGPGTAVVCEVVSATGSILGVRMRTVTGAPEAVEFDSATTLFVDTATGLFSDAAALWTDAAAQELAGHIVTSAEREAGALLGSRPAIDDEVVAMVRAALASTLPSPAGTFVFTLPPGFTSPSLAALGVPPSEAPTLVEVSAATAQALSSPSGATVLASASLPYTAPAAVPAGADRVDCRLLPCVALTYDDGPSSYTSQILDDLAAHHASATFYVLGQSVRGYADTIRRAVAEGHLVENHSWNHPHLTELPAPSVSSQIGDTTAAIEAVTGIPVTSFRPPYGDFDAEVLAAAGLPAILWDVDTRDWQRPDESVLVRRVVDQPSPGSIVLLHDVHPGTARTADAAYEGLRDRGFMLVNLAQLFGGSVPASGAWRSAR